MCVCVCVCWDTVHFEVALAGWQGHAMKNQTVVRGRERGRGGGGGVRGSAVTWVTLRFTGGGHNNRNICTVQGNTNNNVCVGSSKRLLHALFVEEWLCAGLVVVVVPRPASPCTASARQRLLPMFNLMCSFPKISSHRAHITVAREAT